jgi:hypothetical protein
MREIARPYRVPRELNQGGTAITEVVFVDTALAPVICAVPAGFMGPSTSTGRQLARLKIYAGGRVTGGGTTNFTPQLQFGASSTAASNTDIESGAAVAVNSASGAWEIQADILMQVTGTNTVRIDGVASSLVGGSTRTYTATAVTDTLVTTYDPSLLTSVQGFLVSGTFSAGFATNAAYLDYFVMETLG